MIKEQVAAAREKSQKKQFATKIIDAIEKLKNDSTQLSSKRWIWELLQNTHDVAYPGERLDVYIKLNTTDPNQATLEYMHNGKVFNIENLVFLMEQVSSKDRNENRENVSGKFGTGFLTTYLLSLKINIEGIINLKDDLYKSFRVDIDRSSSDIDTLIASIDASTEQLNGIESIPAIDDFDERNFNTKFNYFLDEKGINLAKSGLEDLINFVPYTMVFLDKFNSIILEENGRKTFEIKLKESKEYNNNYSKHFLEIYYEGVEKEIIFLKAANEFGEIICEIDKGSSFKFKEIPKDIPCLYARFPLIGTEDLPLKVIYNSWRFYVTEPRDGVLLFEESNEHVKENRKIIEELTKLFLDLVERVSKKDRCLSVFNILPLNKKVNKHWLSEDWFQREIINLIRKGISNLPIIYNQDNNKINMYDANNANIFLPKATDEDTLGEVWGLLSSIKSINLFKFEELDYWSKIIWDNELKVTLDKLVDTLDKKETLDSLNEALKSDILPLDWLNTLYRLKPFRSGSNSNKAILLNQDNEFVKHNEISIDNKLPSELKNVLKYFGANPYKELLHLDINSEFFNEMPSISSETLIERIKTKISLNKYSDFPKAFNYLVSLIPNEDAFKQNRINFYDTTASMLLDNEFEKTFVSYEIEEVWELINPKITEYVCSCINECENIQMLKEKLNYDSIEGAIHWINDFIALLTKNNLSNLYNSNENKLFPNQNGIMVSKDDIYLDNGDIPEKLKDILELLGKDIRNELLDKGVFLEMPENRVMDSEMIADQIKKSITPLIAEYPRTNETMQVLSQLYSWFVANKELGKQLFGKLYDDRHRLCDDEIIAENIKKAEQLDRLFDEYNIQGIENLREILIDTNSVKPEEIQKQEISIDSLVSLGITTPEELEAAFQNQGLQNEFIHSSISTVQMFEKAQEKIERAKRNIIEYLKKDNQYNLDDVEEIAPTIFGGIRKNDRDIQIVVRPSDNDMVIIYSDSEKNVLDYADSELWIENGVSSPLNLTLGKVFKSAGINKIPLKY